MMMTSKRNFAFRPEVTRRRVLEAELLENRALLSCDATIHSDWLTTGNGSGHSGYVAGSIGTQFEGDLTWTRRLGGGHKVIQNGVVYSSAFGAIRATDLDTGIDLWTRYFGLGREPSFQGTHRSGIWNGGSIAYDDGQLFISAAVGAQVYSVDALTGDVLWETGAVQRSTAHSATIGNGKVYHPNKFGGMLVVDQKTGAGKSVRIANTWDDWSPAFDNGRLFAWIGGKFSEHSPIDGSPLWSIEVELRPDFTPPPAGPMTVVSDGLATIIANRHDFLDFGLKVIDVDTRKLLWSSNSGHFDGASIQPPAIAHGLVYKAEGSTVHVYDSRTGKILPPYRTTGGTWSGPHRAQPIVTDDVVITSSKHETFIYDRLSRELLHKLPIGGELSLGNNALVVSSNSSGVAVFSLCPQGEPLIVEMTSETRENESDVKTVVSIANKVDEDLTVSILSSHPGLVEVPSQVTIPKGKSWAEVPVRIIDNSKLNESASVEVFASAPGYITGRATIEILDDEAAVPSNITGDWQALDRGINRSGYIEGEFGTFLPSEAIWKREQNSGSVAHLKMGHQILFDPTSQQALNAHTGDSVWKKNVPAGVAFGNTMYGLSDGRAYAVDMISGKIQWVETISESWSHKSSIVVADEFIFYLVDGELYRLDRATGKIEASIRAREDNATLIENVLLLRGRDWIRAITPDTLYELWSSRIENDPGRREVTGNVAALNGIAVLNSNMGLFAYDVRTGEMIWQVKGVTSQPALDRESVYATRSGWLYQFDAKTGQQIRILWSGAEGQQPLITDDAIIVRSSNTTRVIDKASGEIRDYFPGGGPFRLTSDFIVTSGHNSVSVLPLARTPSIQLDLPSAIFEAEETFSGTVSIPEPVDSDVVVSLVSDLAGNLEIPAYVKILAGGTSASFTGAVRNDTRFQSHFQGYVLASANDYSASSVPVEIHDDDPKLPRDIPGGWTHVNGGASHRSYVGGTLGDETQQRDAWQLVFEDDVVTNSRITVFNGRVYFTVVTSSGSEDGRVYRVELRAHESESGFEVLRTVVGEGFGASTPVIKDGSIFVAFSKATGSQKSLKVVSLDEVTGNQNWSYEQDVDEYSNFENFAVSGSTAVVPIEDSKRFVALSQASGEQKFTHEGRPLLDYNRLFAGDSEVFRELDIDTGEVLWEHDVGSSSQDSTILSSMISNGIAIVAVSNSRSGLDAITAIDVNSRKVQWTQTVHYEKRPAVSDDTVYIIDGRFLRSLDLHTGNTKFAIYNRVALDEVVATDDAIVILDRHYDIQVYDSQSARLRWRNAPTDRVASGVSFAALAENRLFVEHSKRITAYEVAATNPRLDVNQDTLVTPLDALLIINELNRDQSTDNEKLDVNEDGMVTPLDVLLVINHLNGHASGEGEPPVEPLWFSRSTAFDRVYANWPSDDEKRREHAFFW